MDFESSHRAKWCADLNSLRYELTSKLWWPGRAPGHLRGWFPFAIFRQVAARVRTVPLSLSLSLSLSLPTCRTMETACQRRDKATETHQAARWETIVMRRKEHIRPERNILQWASNVRVCLNFEWKVECKPSLAHTHVKKKGRNVDTEAIELDQIGLGNIYESKPQSGYTCAGSSWVNLHCFSEYCSFRLKCSRFNNESVKSA